jgi:sulfur-oxidizing protein SoxA
MSLGAHRSSLLSVALLLFVVVGFVAVQSDAGEIPPDQKRSDYSLMSRETQAMQDDPMANPGTLWVLDGEVLWEQKAGALQRSCADCHGAAGSSMKGVAARYPVFNAATGRPVNLEQQVNMCRAERQQAAPLAPESKELLALTAYVATQSRGMPIEEKSDPKLQPFIENGRALFHLRQGQFNLSCSQCHDDNWGKRLAGNTIPQGHPNGYPLYRLEWQSLGSLQRRFRNCLVGVRAEPFPHGAPELVDLELYLMSRASGVPIETPAVRP